MTVTFAFDAPTAVYCPEAPVIPANLPDLDFTILLRAPESVRTARHWVRDTLGKFGVPGEAIDNAVQIVSEFCQNSVRHVPAVPGAPGVMTVTAAVWNGQVKITVSDPGELFEPPIVGPNGSGERESGYGLRTIVRALSSDWGIERIHGGKVAWALIQLATSGGA